jgi:surface carbohydrate biosynthesis protein (TIGR04326 family)
VIIWDSRKEKKNQISIISYLEKHKNEIKKEFISFIDNIPNKEIDTNRVEELFDIGEGFSLWWMTSIAEKNPWRRENLYEVLKVIALKKIIKEHSPKKISLDFANLALANSLRSMESSQNFLFSYRYPLKKINNYIFLKKLFLFILPFLKYLKFNKYFFYMKTNKFEQHSKNNISFFSYFDNFDLRDEKEFFFHSNYWGNSQELFLKSNCFLNWMHLFIPNEQIKNPKEGLDKINLINERLLNKQNHKILEEYLSLKLLYKVFKKLFFLIRIVSKININDVQKIFAYKGSDLSFYFIEDFYEDFIGFESFKNLMWLELLKEYFKNLPNQKIGFYLCEELPWEKALIYHWKENNHGPLIAVPHGFNLRYWDIYYFKNIKDLINTKSNLPLPDKYIANNEAFYNELLEYYPKEKIEKLESLRYSWLENRSQKKIKKLSSLKVLILGDYLENLTFDLLEIFRKAKTHIDEKYIFELKLHHNQPMKKYPLNNLGIKIIKENLKDCLKNYDLCICGNMTYASVDAYLSSLDIMIFIPDDKINVSPLNDSQARFIKNERELIEYLNNFKFLTRDFKKIIFDDGNLTKWKNFLKNYDI